MCAVDRDGHGHVLADHSVTGASPEGWAGAVVAAAAPIASVQRWPVVVAEINQGGHMVKSVLRSAGLAAPVKTVRAKDGKAERAVPIALLFEQGRVSLHGEMALLEEELSGLVAGAAYQGPGASPDRADAMVWALGEVMVRRVVGAGVLRGQCGGPYHSPRHQQKTPIRSCEAQFQSLVRAINQQ